MTVTWWLLWAALVFGWGLSRRPRKEEDDR